MLFLFLVDCLSETPFACLSEGVGVYSSLFMIMSMVFPHNTLDRQSVGITLMVQMPPR
jgi:hypothetical protein